MNALKNKIEKRLEVICNQFIEEHIGDAKLKLMPPKDNIPIIKNIYYEKNTDIFKIYFNEEYNYHTIKSKSNIDFLEDQLGHLMAIHIKNFSKLNIENIMLNIFTTIKNEIEQVSLQLIAKHDILNNVIDKRKLMFLNDVVKNNYNELRREYVE